MNSNSLRFLAALTVALAIPAQARAQVAEPRTQTPARKSVHADAHARITAALDGAQQRVLAGDLDASAYDELTAAIRDGYAGLAGSMPDTSTVRARLLAAVEDTYRRAKIAKIAPEEFAALRVDVLDAHVQELLAGASQHAGEKGALEPLSNGLKELADAAQAVDPGSAEWRTRAQSMLEGLKAKEPLDAADFEPLREELVHARALRAETLLEKHATARGATPTDFARARNHLADEFERDAKKDPQARERQKKLVAAVDALEKRAAESSLTPADFEGLRKQMAVRPQEEPAGKQKAHG